MATKSFLLSCLLMGLGTSQHPVSEGTQTPDISTFTDTAGFTAITDSLMPSDAWDCKFSSEDFAKYKELFIRVLEMPEQTQIDCVPLCPFDPILDTPECEPLVEFEDFMEQKCDGESDVLSHTREIVNRAVFSRHTNEDRLEPQGEDEPYHPVLRPIHDDCDILEDPELHLMCVLEELERALCEQEPWHPECRDSEVSTAEELDLLGEGFVIPIADDGGFLGQAQATAASELWEIAGPIEWTSWPDLEPFFQECELDLGYITGDCVYEKMREEVCSNIPGDELCQVPPANLINALINERDLPLDTKAAEISN